MNIAMDAIGRRYRTGREAVGQLLKKPTKVKAAMACSPALLGTAIYLVAFGLYHIPSVQSVLAGRVHLLGMTLTRSDFIGSVGGAAWLLGTLVSLGLFAVLFAFRESPKPNTEVGCKAAFAETKMGNYGTHVAPSVDPVFGATSKSVEDFHTL